MSMGWQEKRVQVDGLDLFYVEKGEGEPLVLIHGFIVNHRVFKDVIDPLAKKFRVIAPDLPGFGESARPPAFSYDFVGFADAMAGFLKAVDAFPARILGHSMGGAVSLATTVLHPGTASSLVLVNALCYPNPLPLQARIALLPGIGSFLFKTFYSRGELKRYFVRDVFNDPALATDEMIDYFWECFLRPGGKDAAYRTLTTLSNSAPIGELPPRVKCPTLIVWGEDDRIFPLAHGKRLAGEIDGSELRIVKQCGHSPPEEKTSEFLSQVTPFLEKQ